MIHRLLEIIIVHLGHAHSCYRSSIVYTRLISIIVLHNHAIQSKVDEHNVNKENDNKYNLKRMDVLNVFSVYPVLFISLYAINITISFADKHFSSSHTHLYTHSGRTIRSVCDRNIGHRNTVLS